MAKKALKVPGGRRFTVVLQKESVGGYSVRCVEIPEAISQGETREEALKNIKEAIRARFRISGRKSEIQKGKNLEFAEIVV